MSSTINSRLHGGRWIAEASQVFYGRDQIEKTPRRILIGDADDEDDGLGSPL
jgi:hypothetical protein